MIVVTVGTNEAPFDRLLRSLVELPPDESVVVQYGHSPKIHARHAEAVDFMPFDAMVETIRRARVVVTHAGVGSVMVSLSQGKRPIVVPRRKTLGEAVDDHQLQLARRFAEAGLVTLVEATESLPRLVAGGHEPIAVAQASEQLAGDIRSFLDEAVTAQPAGPCR